jgi:hypothetical protein
MVDRGLPLDRARNVSLASAMSVAGDITGTAGQAAIAVHRDYIVSQLAAGLTMATIWQRLRDERGLAASVAALRRYVAPNLPEEARRSQLRVLRLVPAEPGGEAQIDYGQLGRWLDPRTGRRHALNADSIRASSSAELWTATNFVTTWAGFI